MSLLLFTSKEPIQGQPMVLPDAKCKGADGNVKSEIERLGVVWKHHHTEGEGDKKETRHEERDTGEDSHQAGNSHNDKEKGKGEGVGVAHPAGEEAVFGDTFRDDAHLLFEVGEAVAFVAPKFFDAGKKETETDPEAEKEETGL